MKILVATGNIGKIKEFKELLDSNIEWLGLKDFDNITEVEEDGQTFAENAQKKALGYAKQTGCITIADDSGLEIEALNGAPGIHSARFSGTHKDHRTGSLIDHENIQKVLELMKDTPASKRNAQFVCALCIASPSEILFETKGTMRGTILTKQHGSGGFGYDPIFYFPPLDKTNSQMDPAEKNEISHRGQAVKNAKPFIQSLIKANAK